ncbi:MAG TPA: hypothetical protein VI365_02805, partial [Trebonia sp.]
MSIRPSEYCPGCSSRGCIEPAAGWKTAYDAEGQGQHREERDAGMPQGESSRGEGDHGTEHV